MIRHGSSPFLECSSRGDKRFSAFFAKIKNRNNQSIESIYQGAKILSDGRTGLSWREAKGQNPINKKEVSELYSQLWDEYIEENPSLIEILLSFNGTSDTFGQPGHCCQATELWRIKNQFLNKKTKVVNIKKNKYDVYIGRAGHNLDGYFGNPYRVGYDGNRLEVLELYRKYFYDRINNDIEFRERVYQLKGKTLGCFCKPEKCHGDIIADYLNHLGQDKMIKFKQCNCAIEAEKFSINDIPLNCPATWELISSGMCVGIFQLESRLGRDWAQKVKPENIKELAALISILRPAALESGQADAYVDNKFGFAQHKTLHQKIDEILKDTHFSLVYQEQAMKIAVEIAGFSLIDSDNLRKATGKKLPALMSKMKTKFLHGAKALGLVSEEMAQEIFSWIEKGQRYGFNRSHAISYAMLGYQSAYIKAHFPLQFFVSYLNFSHYKQDPKEEIYNLVQDSKLFGININPPNIQHKNANFTIIDNEIYFGLGHIRSVGQSAISKILNQIEHNMSTWQQFLMTVPLIHRNVGIALIKSGACDCYGLQRLDMIRELEILFGSTTIDENGKKQEIKGLTNKELEYLFSRFQDNLSVKNILIEMSEGQNTKSLSSMKKNELIDIYTQYFDEEPENKIKKSDLLEKLKQANYNNDKKRGCSNDTRREMMAEKAAILDIPLQESSRSKAEAEKHFLGIALSCSAADDVDSNEATHTCLEVQTATNEERFCVCVIIDDVKHTVTKRGRNPGQRMCFLTISDSTYSIDHAVVFPDVYKEFKHLCQKDFICLISGYKKQGSCIIDNMKKLL